MVGVPVAIIDLDASVLASSNWQTVCRDFHRKNPDSYARCIVTQTSFSKK